MRPSTDAVSPRYVSADFEPGQWQQVEQMGQQLLDREVASAEELDNWLLDRSELDAWCAEHRTNLFIDMTCDTEDQAVSDAYSTYIHEIAPKMRTLTYELDQRYIELAERIKPDAARYGLLERMKRAEVDTYRKENVPLQTRLSELEQEYSKVVGSMTIDWHGTELTIPQMARFMQDQDRATRQNAWEAVATRRIHDRETLNTLYDQMIVTRNTIASNAGKPTYIEYAFQAMQRFDYTPQDCETFWESVESEVVPLMRKVDEERRAALKLDSLRPWDLQVDVKGRGPLRPFEGGRELYDRTLAVIQQLDPRLATLLKRMDDAPDARSEDGTLRTRSLDLDSRKAKRPGGYQTVRMRQRKPFIFMNAAGMHQDVKTMIHEAGHAFHSMLAIDEPILDYWHAPIEFCEVASMSMELLTMPHWGAPGGFYRSDEDLARAQRELLEGIVGVLPWIASIDAFQHWIYRNPGHDASQRDEQWLSIDERFGHKLDWAGFEPHRASHWQKQGHLYAHPLYYIEYGIAQLGALQLWLKAKRDGDRSAIDAYIDALTLGGSQRLPELFEAADIKFDFSKSTIARLVDAINEELDTLPY